MPNSGLDLLIRDTLTLLKDPLTPKQTLFSSAEEMAFFRPKVSKTIPVPPPEPVKTVFKPVRTEKPVQKKEIPMQHAEPVVLEVKKQEPPRQSPPTADNTSQIKSTLQRIAPHLSITDEVPNDDYAKKIANSWKEKVPDVDVILLACQTDSDTLELLKSLGKAIDQHLCRAKIIPAEKLEKENRWDFFLQKNPFRLIVASEGMKQLPSLMTFYHAIPAQSQTFLDKIPLLALGPSSQYKAIDQKAHLWKTLCQILKK